MSLLSKAIEDALDYFEEDLPKSIKDYVEEEIFNDIVKYSRIKLQVAAVKVINAAEEIAVKEAIDAMNELGIPVIGVEQILRDIYWRPFDLLKAHYGAEWLVDT